MEPTIYEPSIYKGAGIYKVGAQGGGGGGGDLPDEYQKLLYVYINGTADPIINSNSWIYQFNMPSFTFGDKIDVLTEIKVDTSLDGDRQLMVINREQSGAARGFIFRQMKNYLPDIPYEFDVRLMGPYNGIDETFKNTDPNNTNGFYNTISGAGATRLYVELNSQIRAGLGDKNSIANLSIFESTDYIAYNGTKLFYIKIGDKVNLVPCRRISDGQIGMFCTINNKFIYPHFYPNSWSGGTPI